MAGHISFFSGSHPTFELRHLLQWELGQISCPVEILGSFQKIPLFFIIVGLSQEGQVVLLTDISVLHKFEDVFHVGRLFSIVKPAFYVAEIFFSERRAEEFFFRQELKKTFRGHVKL